MIYITGDTHLPIDAKKLNPSRFPEQKTLTKSDYVIICGDFGGIWSGREDDVLWLKWISSRNFTTLFVDGNHENHRLLNENYDIVSYCGGKAHKIKNDVYHLMRGQVFVIDGIKFFTMGGGKSHDRAFRIEGLNWWREEMPSKDEYNEATANLEKHNFTVDYVITHCAPDSIQRQMESYYLGDKLTAFLEDIKNKLNYRHWYFGHYHYDMYVDDKHTCLYNNIVKLDIGK